MKIKIDPYDRKIMYELDFNSRIPVSVLARKVHLPKETVHYRIKRLEASGTLKYFHALINASYLGYLYYRVGFKFSFITAKMEDEIVEFLTAEKSCSNIRIGEGRYDVVFIAIHKTARNLTEFLARFGQRFGSKLIHKDIHKIVNSYKIGRRMFFEGQRVKTTISHSEPQDYTLDRIDLGILKAFSRAARIHLVELAGILHADPKVIRYHIDRLEERGIIVGYSMAIDYLQFEAERVELHLSLKHHGLVGQIIDFFDELRTCTFAYELLGTDDLSLELYVEDDEQLRIILRRFRERFGENCLSYALTRIYEEHLSDWSPLEMSEKQARDAPVSVQFQPSAPVRTRAFKRQRTKAIS